MHVKLDAAWRDKLNRLPEDPNDLMYHLVDVYLRNGRVVRRCELLNCAVLELPGDTGGFALEEIKDIKLV